MLGVTEKEALEQAERMVRGLSEASQIPFPEGLIGVRSVAPDPYQHLLDEGSLIMSRAVIGSSRASVTLGQSRGSFDVIEPAP